MRANSDKDLFTIVLKIPQQIKTALKQGFVEATIAWPRQVPLAYLGLLVSILSLLAISLPGSADVNMKDGSFVISHSDLKVSSEKEQTSFSRGYSSRSTFNGVFGFGWCTDFEIKIRVTESKELELEKCEYTQTFVLHNISLTKGKIYRLGHSGEQHSEELRYQGGVFSYIVDGEILAKFEGSGRLKLLRSKTKGTIQVRYDLENRPALILFSSTESIKLLYKGHDHLVGKLKTSGGIELTYTYSLGELVRVRQNNNDLYSYKYNSLHNLRKVKLPNKKTLQMNYDKDRDLLVSISEESGCYQKFKYQNSGVAGEDRYVSSAYKICDGRVLSTSSFQFINRVRSDGQKYLAEMIVQKGKKKVQVIYDSYSGLPILVEPIGENNPNPGG